MRFGEIDVAEGEGALLAHSIRDGDIRFAKGRRLSGEDVTALAQAGYTRITAAVLDPADVHEDEAAERLAAALADPAVEANAPFTGRVNLYAREAGVLELDVERLHRINAVDEAITVATLEAHAAVTAGQMVATIKIIPFAAPEASLALTEAIGRQRGPVLRVAPYRPRRVGLIQTRLAGTAAKMLDKTVQVTADRLAALGCQPPRERRCAHNAKTLAGEIRAMIEAGTELVLLAGASAIVDRRDVLPSAIELAGGTVDHFGMPVDPGNLILMGHVGATPVVGLPGCARSPKLNGMDWVLQRLMADLPVGRAEIMRMGPGGLLAEIPTRPRPREAEQAPTMGKPSIAAIVLAAGKSRRMGGINKLTAKVAGKPMLRHAVDAALASECDPVIVVTGHERDRVVGLLGDQPVQTVDNPNYADGLSTSVRAGAAALPAEIDGFIVLLGDMPGIDAAVINRLIAAFNPVEGRGIIVPTVRGKRGNPVLWDRRFAGDMAGLTGDAGAKHLIGEYDELVAEVAFEEETVLHDLDTPEALASYTDGAREETA
jgi:molybdenum cofactor cytidylyltransferase